MKKVLQERVNQKDGDCARAAMATLFGKELHDMPNFFPNERQALEIMNYFEELGHDPTYFNRRKKGYTTQNGSRCPTIEEAAKYDGGINGFFYASVPSQTFRTGSHAVVVDTDLNIVHDPNPNQKAMELGPDDVKEIITVGNWHIDLDGKFVDE